MKNKIMKKFSETIKGKTILFNFNSIIGKKVLEGNQMKNQAEKKKKKEDDKESKSLITSEQNYIYSLPKTINNDK